MFDQRNINYINGQHLKKKMLKFVTPFQRIKYFDIFKRHPK